MMEKKGLRKKDMLRMDGLLPPTRRLPVCDAVPGDKKKDRKWSLGGILRRISSIRDCDSSSNDEEIVYCKRTPRKPTKLNRRPDGVVLHAIENNADYDNKRLRIEDVARHSSPSRRDSRSSDGSWDGSGKKTRKDKLKARAAAKRDHLRVDSSSDEDCRRSNGSLNRFHGADGPRGNRKTRAARTERYIKRLSRDDGGGDTSNDAQHKRYEDEQRVVYADGSCRPPVHPRRATPVIPVQKPNRAPLPPQRSPPVESLRIDAALPEIGSDFSRYGQYVTDMNQNNTYGKISPSIDAGSCQQGGNFFTYPAKSVVCRPFDRAVERRLIGQDNHRPPEPPPRDPRYRVFGYNSYPTNRHQNASSCCERGYGGPARPGDWRNFRSYGSSNEIARRCDPDSPTSPGTEFCNSLEYANNRYNSSRHCQPLREETELIRRRNIRNDQLNCEGEAANFSAHIAKNTSASICESGRQRETTHVSAATDWLSRRSPCVERITSPAVVPTRDEKMAKNRGMTPAEEALERRRSSKNLEEALSELEAIYNSLRLGDEDLLDRAERRSMEEFKRGRSEVVVAAISPDSPDRTKDDMAYRRMHPKERPTSDIAGRSTLSNISYLITSPVLSRREDDLKRAAVGYSASSRRDEPDVTRDDMLFRSINHANNTLKVIDPQPPFGIPLGPVTAATESDYLHTTPTKPEQPRSPYIPQCEPDVVTDDLAYRALRKDATRNGPRTEPPSAAPTTGGVAKKRAVRSLSASLYGLINHDRIHLRREPSLDDVQDIARSPISRPYLRRVVSDGELSDNDARKEPAARGHDINGNHPTAYRKRLSSPEMTARQSPKKESSVAEISDAVLSSKAALDEEFWHEYLRPDSNSSRSTEADFSAYSRLCQDLVNLIKGDDESPNEERTAVAPAGDKSNDDEVVVATGSRARSVADRYSLGCEPTMHSILSAESRDSSTTDDNLDFYLRVADENVKLIAAAFGSVADHLRDSRLSARKNSSTSRDLSELENQSTRSSTLYSPDDDQPTTTTVVSPKPEEARVLSKRDSFTSNEGDQSSDRHFEQDVFTADVDLSKAVHDLQLAAAKLCEHGREIEDLARDRKIDTGVHKMATTAVGSDTNEESLVRKIDLIADARKKERGCRREEEEEEEEEARVHDATPFTTAISARDENEEKSLIAKISFIADDLTQERERDQEEVVVLPPSGIAEPREREARGENCEGERITCELDCKSSSRSTQDARSCVTNIITCATVTTYSMLLLACLLALLLAIVAAS